VIANIATRPFNFYPFVDSDGAVIMAGRREATERDIDSFLHRHDVEIELDRLTLEMCAHERSQGNSLEKWQLDAELASFNRTRKRAA